MKKLRVLWFLFFFLEYGVTHGSILEMRMKTPKSKATYDHESKTSCGTEAQETKKR